MHKLQDYLVTWIKEKVNEAGAQGGIIGLSGGVDSAVSAALTKIAFPNSSLGIIMPCQSCTEDAELAKLFAERINLEYKEVDLTPLFDQMLELLGASQTKNTKLVVSNIKPRLRMTVLYYFAAERKSLVVGTGNKSEIMTGYFTKYGDGAVDIEPLGNLYKTQVYQLAKYLNIPEQIIQRPPSAGLWQNQTDEKEMGITYYDLDKYLYSGKAEESVKVLVNKLIEKSQHKRELPPIPEKNFDLIF